MFKLRKRPNGSASSVLYDQDMFYRAFFDDMRHCKRQLIIESPFITRKRMLKLLPMLRELRQRGVRIVINTRDPEEHDGIYRTQAVEAIARLHALDVVVIYTVGHHRKLAIIDERIVWEGSLNILSFNDSCEIMKRTVSPTEAEILINFIGIRQYLQDE
jgi:phosphatidylserine/phosphatidylglycerophosphate/cardiolipin synthase-like enzyme